LMPLIILCLYLVVMSRWCEQRDLLVAFLSHGRHGHPEFREMIGCIAHSVPLRIEIGKESRLRDLISLATTEFHSSLAHDASRLLPTDISSDTTDLSFNWFPAGWGLYGSYPSPVRKPHDHDADLTIKRFAVDKPVEAGAKFIPFFSDTPSGILLVIWYGSHLLLKSAVDRFAVQIKAAAEIFVQDPDVTVNSLMRKYDQTS